MKVLLIEDSETCAECLLGIYNKRWFCLATGKDIDIISKSRYEKPSWCPLRPLPAEIDQDEIESDREYYMAVGFNACLEKIGATE